MIVSLLIGSDHEHHERARAFFEPVREGGASAYVPSAVIAECVYVLTKAYKVPREEAAAQLIALLDYRGVTVESPASRRALELYRSHKVDFVDALVAAVADEQGGQVFSFDRDLSRLTR